jgi:signal peptide peptidase SppA
VKYQNVVGYVGSTQWAMLPAKMQELLSVLAFRAAGHTFTPEEIKARIGDGSESPTPTSRGAIAIIPLRGVIAHRMGTMDESSGGMSAERFAAMVRAAAADPNVGTILIDCDSPGGTIPGVPEAADAVYQARDSKRVVAVANSMMASAAYWIASQANEIVAIPSAIEGKIGSIGAFFVHQDLSQALENEGIKTTLIYAGDHKVDGSPFAPLSDERKAELQAMADATHLQFMKTVARGRGVSLSAVRSGFGQGRALSAVDAKAAGMVDRIEPFDQTIARLAGRSAKSVGMRAELEGADGLVAAGVMSAEQITTLEEQVTADLAAGTADADRLRRMERF